MGVGLQRPMQAPSRGSDRDRAGLCVQARAEQVGPCSQQLSEQGRQSSAWPGARSRDGDVHVFGHGAIADVYLQLVPPRTSGVARMRPRAAFRGVRSGDTLRSPETGLAVVTLRSGHRPLDPPVMSICADFGGDRKGLMALPSVLVSCKCASRPSTMSGPVKRGIGSPPEPWLPRTRPRANPAGRSQRERAAALGGAALFAVPGGGRHQHISVYGSAVREGDDACPHRPGWSGRPHQCSCPQALGAGKRDDGRPGLPVVVSGREGSPTTRLPSRHVGAPDIGPRHAAIVST
jgi:hypothetical protein